MTKRSKQNTGLPGSDIASPLSLCRVMGLLLALACGCSPLALAAAPNIEASPQVLDFGGQAFGTSGQLVTTVSNTGTTALQVSNLSTTHGTFTVASPATTFSIPAGASQDVTVAFTPTAVALWNAELLIDSDDPDQPRLSVSLSGQGVSLAGCGGDPAPTVDIEVSPLSLDFGDIEIGGEGQLLATVNNVGTADLELTSLGSTDPAFSIVMPTLPLIIPAGGSQAISIMFNPAIEGAASADLLIDSNDADESRVTVSLSGNATSGALFPNSFVTQLQNVASGQCVEASGSGDGDNVVQAPCVADQANQRLNFVPVPGLADTYTLVFQHSNKCLDVTGADYSNGANIQQLQCTGGDSQRYTLIYQGSDYSLLTHTGSGDKIVDLYEAIGNIIQWQDYGKTNQRWRFFSDSQDVLTAGAPSGSAFYQTPQPLDGSNGDVYWAEEISGVGNGRIWKMLYHSQDLHGNPLAVSGWLAIPNSARPSGGYPIVSFAHGTTGINDSCAPTQRSTPADTIALLDDFLARGYVVAATDYQGLGTPGVHHYLIGPSEAYSVLDAARAARNVAGGSDEVILFGHSQGGQAVLFANELAVGHAPGLSILGTVSSGSAISGMDGTVIEQVKTSVYKGYLVMAAVAQEAAYGAAESPLSRWLTPYGIQAADALDSICVDQLTATYGSLTSSDLFVAGAPLDTTTGQFDVDADTTPGLRPGSSPILLLHGRNDPQVPAELVPAWAENTCNQLGQAIQLTWFNTGHRVPYEAPSSVASVMFDWIDDRFNGQTPSFNCSMPQP